MSVKAAIGHQLINEEQLTASMTPTDELHKVPVPKPTYDSHLRDVLLLTLLRPLGHSFDSNLKV
jgi:hypothetical protein